MQTLETVRTVPSHLEAARDCACRASCQVAVALHKSRQASTKPASNLTKLYRKTTFSGKVWLGWDLLASYMQGLVGDWTLPREIARDYLKQVTAEKRVEQTDPKGRVKHVWHQVRKDNHLWDCELMVLVAAVITRIVQESCHILQ